MSRNKSEDAYSNCIPTMVPINKELHKALKIYCVEKNMTMKELLYDINNKGISAILGDCNE